MLNNKKYKIGVITPYHLESNDVLNQCHESVLRQTYPCQHILVADGHPNNIIDSWDASHIILPVQHSDNGDTPRTIGSICAANEGYDAIAYLDADNWFYPEHIESMVSLYEKTTADVCTSRRSIHRLDGSLMFIDGESDGDKFSDTSCIFLTKNAFTLSLIWAFIPNEISPFCDRFF
ncbi:MAG: glycosyltransferase [Nanoarchaeota archaeon]